MSEVSGEEELYAPCIAACPVHTDTRRLAELITLNKYEEALELLLTANPFTSVCGRICHHPCEQHCRRIKVDSPVGLMKLKRFVVEAAGDYRILRRKKMKPEKLRDEHIAVIGSGPSGMTAAYDLRRKGFSVTVFEKEETPGGMLGNTLPRYRLPYSVVMEDIEDILSIGVELKTGVEIGKDITLDELFTMGFKSVLISTGLSESRTLNIPGIDSEGVLLALPFLHMVLSPNPPVLGKRVIVVGGGNVAIDVARSARRLGADKVTMVCLESENEMPAWKWEVDEAEEEGIDVLHSWGPRDIFTEEGKVKGIEFKRCVSVFGEDGRFNPVFNDSDIKALPADNIIIAIGQRGDLTALNGSNIEIKPRHRLEVDPETLSTSRPGVFACGEVFTGPGSSVQAVRSGHRAAEAIVHYLDTGELLSQPVEEFAPLGELPEETADKIKKMNPVHTDVLPVETRLREFSEIEKGFTEKEAHEEARRCLDCMTGAEADEEKCAACLTCVRMCPFGVASVDKTAVMPEEQCQACGLCAAACPAAAIALQKFGTNKMKDQLLDMFRGINTETAVKPLVVSYCCLYELESRKYFDERSVHLSESGIYRVMVPCVARLSVPDILSPFELGVDGVSIISCREKTCLYPTAEERLADRIHKAREVLEEVGVDGKRIAYHRTEISAEESWPGLWAAFRDELKKIEDE